MPPDPEAALRFYLAAVIVLRALTAGRPTALADVQHELALPSNKRATFAARINAWCAIAALRWPEAFSPALLFNLPRRTAEDVMGGGWVSLDGRFAAQLWRATPVLEGAAALRAVAHALETRPYEMRGQYLGLTATSSVRVGGLYATWQTAEEFLTRPELSFTRQVAVVGVRPEERQMAALVAPITGSSTATRICSPADAAGLPEPDLRLWSQDASDEIARHIRPARAGSFGR